MSDQTPSLLGTEEPAVYTPTSDEKTMGLLSHLLAIFFGFIPPLIIWLVKKDDSRFASEHAKESLNFQITMIIAYVICFILFFLIVGIFLIWLVHIYRLVLCIIATIKTNEGKMYKYPLTLRLIK